MAVPAESYQGGVTPAAPVGRRSRVPARTVVGPTSAVVTEVSIASVWYFLDLLGQLAALSSSWVLEGSHIAQLIRCRA